MASLAEVAGGCRRGCAHSAGLCLSGTGSTVARAQHNGQHPSVHKCPARGSQINYFPKVRNSGSPGALGLEETHPLEFHTACKPWNGAGATALSADSPAQGTANLVPAHWGREEVFNPVPIPGVCSGTLIPWPPAPRAALKMDPALLLGWTIPASSISFLLLNYSRCGMQEEGIH